MDGSVGDGQATSVPEARGLLAGLGTLRDYQIGALPHDLAAGLALTALLVPAGLGYAQAAGLPAITGLYATVLPLLAYAIVGPSRIMILGPDSSLAPLIAAAVLPLAAGDAERAVDLAGMLALLVGGLGILAGLARLGFVTDLLSKPVRHGYLNGIALVVLVSQLPKVLGFPVASETVAAQLRDIAEGVLRGQTNGISLAIGFASLAVILGLRRLDRRLPGVLVAVVGATVLTAALGLAASAGIAVVGTLPQGLPPIRLPAFEPDALAGLLPAAIGIALVSFADTSALSRTFAARGRYEVNPNSELGALGIANCAAGLASGFPVSSSSSRTPVAEAAGARTQVTGIVGAAAIALLLVAAPGLVADLPQAALGAVVIAAALSLFDVQSFVRLYGARESEFMLGLISFLGVALIGVIPGIFIAVVLSLVAFLQRAWRPHDAVLGRATGVKGYHDVTYYPHARLIPGLLLYRFDAPLFFANADIFRARVRDRIREAQEGPAGAPRWLVIAAEPITDVDTTAAEMLLELRDELEARGTVLAFAELKDPVKDRLRRYGALGLLGGDRIFPTLGTAVDAYVEATGVSWVDWEEAAPERPT